MKVKEYREMGHDELERKLEELHEQMYALKSQAVTQKLENMMAVRNARRDIARVLTVMREKQLNG